MEHIKMLLVRTSEHVYKNILDKYKKQIIKTGNWLTMLRRFHAMNSVKAQPTLPQSDWGLVADEFVQRGYTIAL